MKKIHIGQSIQVLANVGVLVGLVFVGLEVRQSSTAVATQTADSIADGFIALNVTSITDPDVARFWIIGLDRPQCLSDVEAVQFSMLMRGLFNQFARVYRVYRTGQLPEREWSLFAREAAALMSTSGGQLYFQGNEMDDGLRTELDKYRASEASVDFSLGRDLSKERC